MQATHNPPTAADVDISPAEILRGAARYLQLHGWHRGAFFDTTMLPGPAFLPADIVGAICTAVAGTVATPDRLHGPDAILAKRAMRHLVDAVGLVEQRNDYSELFDLEARLGDWNDDAERTYADITTALTDAADEWDRIHAHLADELAPAVTG